MIRALEYGDACRIADAINNARAPGSSRAFIVPVAIGWNVVRAWRLPAAVRECFP